jgi:hypothetical protein
VQVQPQKRGQVGVERGAARDDRLPQEMRERRALERGLRELSPLAHAPDKDLVLDQHEVLGRRGAHEAAELVQEVALGLDGVAALQEPVDLEHELRPAGRCPRRPGSSGSCLPVPAGHQP